MKIKAGEPCELQLPIGTYDIEVIWHSSESNARHDTWKAGSITINDDIHKSILVQPEVQMD